MLSQLLCFFNGFIVYSVINVCIPLLTPCRSLFLIIPFSLDFFSTLIILSLVFLFSLLFILNCVHLSFTQTTLYLYSFSITLSSYLFLCPINPTVVVSIALIIFCSLMKFITILQLESI